MLVLEFLAKVLGKEENAASKRVAKDRLRLVLVHDRADVSPHLLEALKEDLIRVISDYMEIDTNGLEVSLNNENNTVALIANIPVLRMKRSKLS